MNGDNRHGTGLLTTISLAATRATGRNGVSPVSAPFSVASRMMASTNPCFITEDYLTDRRELIILDDATSVSDEPNSPAVPAGWSIEVRAEGFRLRFPQVS